MTPGAGLGHLGLLAALLFAGCIEPGAMAGWSREGEPRAAAAPRVRFEKYEGPFAYGLVVQPEHLFSVRPLEGGT